MKKLRTRKEAASDLLQAAQEMLAVYQGQNLATARVNLQILCKHNKTLSRNALLDVALQTTFT